MVQDPGVAARRGTLALDLALETAPLSVTIRVSPQELLPEFPSWPPPFASYFSYLFFVSGLELAAASEGDSGGRGAKQTKGMAWATMEKEAAVLLVLELVV
jgi:hypothetical protein